MTAILNGLVERLEVPIAPCTDSVDRSQAATLAPEERPQCVACTRSQVHGRQALVGQDLTIAGCRSTRPL